MNNSSLCASDATIPSVVTSSDVLPEKSSSLDINMDVEFEDTDVRMKSPGNPIDDEGQ